MSKKSKVIIGPTASGKSELSIKIAITEKAEIISADAFQVYKEFTIGTGKLTLVEQHGVPHHLVDFLHPESEYTVQLFLNHVNTLIEQHPQKTFIICGGSAMYIKALLYGYTPLKRLPVKDRPEGSPKELWDLLEKIDPELAKQTPFQNKLRVQRYLELYAIYKTPPTKLFKSKPMDTSKYDVIGIFIEKKVLKERINQRVDTMIKRGLVDEVDYLMKKYDINSPAFQAIGYKEVVQYFQKKHDKDTMIQTIKKNTHQYAKRQMTWFRTFEHVKWIYN